MNPAKTALISAALIGSLFAAIPDASAMPVASVAVASPVAQDGLQDVRFFRRPFHRFHRFGYRRFGYHPYRHRRFFPGRIIRRTIRRVL